MFFLAGILNKNIYIYIYMHISGASKAWRILDTRNYTLPHRRQRVWGLAAVNTGATAESDFSDRFCGFLQAASSHWNFSKEQLFPNLEKEDPKEGRHAGLVAHAREKFAGCDNIYFSMHHANTSHIFYGPWEIPQKCGLDEGRVFGGVYPKAGLFAPNCAFGYFWKLQEPWKLSSGPFYCF